MDLQKILGTVVQGREKLLFAKGKGLRHTVF